VPNVVFAIPGDINLPTGGYAYDRRVMALLPTCGVGVQHLALPATYPNPSVGELALTARLIAASAGSVLMIDGLAYGAMPAQMIRGFERPIVALVHHPLCLEAGLSESRQRELYALETAALAIARHVIVTSAKTRRILVKDFAVPEAKITVAEPGTERVARAQGTGHPVQILAVGSLVPRKGYDVLVRALAPLADRDWRATIAGAVDRDPATTSALNAAIAAAGLADRINLIGPVDETELGRLYAAADLFVLPSLFEGYGMALAEALARGLAIVCSSGIAAVETAPDEAAIKVAPGDAQALSQALRRLLDDTGLRQQLAAAAWTAGQRLPQWPDTAQRVAGVIKAVDG
jgi:glycosyltransferase involved in cell wall biosynthesis